MERYADMLLRNQLHFFPLPHSLALQQVHSRSSGSAPVLPMGRVYAGVNFYS
jgi:hypothetical protein